MIIYIDEKEIIVSDSSKNIVEIGDENGLHIMAPCFRSIKKFGCCKTCVIEIDGKQKFACGTKPIDGMKIIYDREDLVNLRKERISEYAQVIENGGKVTNTCCGSDLKN
ncbi:MAG: (2Fe-2S)-binding protein [Firmicutes bacterium]|nr:(2Fe-2S)-binding protein [Bacillota bacterium]